MTTTRLGLVPALDAVPDDMVLLPREIAEAAYSLLQAMSALKDDAGLALFSALARALDPAPGRDAATPPACAVCGIEIHHGLPHQTSCTSDDALRHRDATIPGLAPGD
jgi:hypothetical protein